jgi:hypothetical protein|tara:strand:+ start:1651 stop:1815 length:165 start_codon:yes stop_codon:yes gene_type:complete
MNKKNLKTLIQDLEIAIAELKAEVYADPSAYIDKSSKRTASSYIDQNDDDGDPD